MTKTFQVVAVSTNTNSFGLHGVVLVAKNGLAFEAGASGFTVQLHHLKVGAHITLNMIEGGDESADAIAWFDWAAKSFEIPRELPACPKKLVKQMWIEPANATNKSSLKRASRAGQAPTAMANYRSK